jgi:hypothetical protein
MIYEYSQHAVIIQIANRAQSGSASSLWVSYKLLILDHVQHTQRGRCNQWLTREQHPDITISALLSSEG